MDGLPEGLEYLEIDRSKLEIIDNLPNTIKKLIIKDNRCNLVIKNLPSSLKELYINNSYWFYYENNPNIYVTTDIECNFPNNLRKLYLHIKFPNDYNPIFPDSLRYIELSGVKNNSTVKIISLPSKLKILRLHGCVNSYLPLLPDELLVLEMHHLNILDNTIIPCSLKQLNSFDIDFISDNFRHTQM